MVLGDLDRNEVKLDDKDERQEAKSLEYHFAVNTSCHGVKVSCHCHYIPK